MHLPPHALALALLLNTAALAPTPNLSPPPDPVPFYPDKLRLLVWKDPHGSEHEIRTPANWTHRRQHILLAMEQVMGQAPVAESLASPEFQVLAQQPFPDYVQQRIQFRTPDGDQVPAYLLLPTPPAPRPSPAVLCLHQTTPSGKAEPAGLAGLASLAYARELAQRGWITLAPDYPNFGDYRVDPYALGYASATRKGIVNHRTALSLLATLPQVDPERLAAIGHSLGGHNALFLAAFDPRVKAVVSSCGFNSFPHYQGGNLAGWSHAGYMPRIASVYHADPRRMPFDFTEVLAALAPRPVFVSAPRHDDNFPLAGVHDCFAAARPVYALFDAAAALVLETPGTGHEFPQATRERAYAWLRAQLRP